MVRQEMVAKDGVRDEMKSLPWNAWIMNIYNRKQDELVSSSDSELRGGRGGKEVSKTMKATWSTKGDGRMNVWPTRH